MPQTGNAKLSGYIGKRIVDGGCHASQKQDGCQISDVKQASHVENHPHANCVENASIEPSSLGRLVLLSYNSLDFLPLVIPKYP